MLMKKNEWVLKTEKLDMQKQLHTAPVYTIGNGLFCVRGFMEEAQEGIEGLGGIYMTGAFGSAEYQPWKGEGRELVNIPNFFWVQIKINGADIIVSPEHMQEFTMELDLSESTFRRSYLYKENKKVLAKFEFERFASRSCIYTAGQRIKVTPLADDLEIEVCMGIRTDITNLNQVSSEPYPVQPGRKQYKEDAPTGEVIAVTIEQPDKIRLGFAQKVNSQEAVFTKKEKVLLYQIKNKANETATIEKLVSISSSTEDGMEVEKVAALRLVQLKSYEEEKEEHRKAMETFWEQSDVRIEGNEEDQLTIRYNILQLVQSCPTHTSHYSIGARGLTGEMYEGSVFWDTEIFMLPFFSLVWPKWAASLLEFRYHTLPEAKAHAASNWFEGAMYGWQVNPNGVEQTPQGVGAYYSIHVVADIAYAILEYWNATKDETFLLEKGLEVLIETARFWASRVKLREDGYYDIMAVRGPNEYGVIVNNNLYTNMMARENFILCRRLLAFFKANSHPKLQELETKLKLQDKELEIWMQIEKKLVLPYQESENLWLEDDTYLRRMKVDMAKAKPTAKRIIDTTIPYEALPFYQVSKQADVLHVMKNLPEYFTREQIETAYEYYRARTAFDSSLAYSMFALMAAKLGKMDEAISYYDNCSKLDIKNVQLNTISGLHLANFGGTWQALVFGFGGVEILEDRIRIMPHIPDKWKKLAFRIFYKNNLLAITIQKNNITIRNLSKEGKDCNAMVETKQGTIAIAAGENVTVTL